MCINRMSQRNANWREDTPMIRADVLKKENDLKKRKLELAERLRAKDNYKCMFFALIALIIVLFIVYVVGQHNIPATDFKLPLFVAKPSIEGAQKPAVGGA